MTHYTNTNNPIDFPKSENGMNERILELADQAIENMPGAWNIPDEFCKKFAELIVQECVTIIDAIPTTPQGAWSDGYYEGCRDSAKAIQEQFGVEE